MPKYIGRLNDRIQNYREISRFFSQLHNSFNLVYHVYVIVFGVNNNNIYFKSNIQSI